MSTWRQSWTAVAWRKFLQAGEAEAELWSIRRRTHNGRPLGPAEFTRALEERTRRRLARRPRGRPRKTPAEAIPQRAET